MCIILQNVKRSPNQHLCSDFQENKIFKTHACNCLIPSPEQFIVMCNQLFSNVLTVYQLWLAFTKDPKCLTKQLKHSLQLGNASFLKVILLLLSRRFVFFITPHFLFPFLKIPLSQDLESSVKPLSHQTAMPPRLYSVLKTCQRAVGSPRNTPKHFKFASYSVYTTSSQRPHSVHTMFPQRLYSVHDASTARKQLLQRVHGASTAFVQRL